ncbi:MAG TPA: response regulator [Pyrinomonadaceae bacterium]|nr:response regulator [Pyrinomonadaceae bacterium]
MLAGRKLLLADDSITIQKVVDLTFADEGVRVLCLNNGRDAIDQIEGFAPDIVLADVFMPQVNGYEVCEYIKQNEKLKHIPVMLLVGSFEPFDEAEARRVGADDTLTKPFQSIRRLVDKVSSLVSGRQPEGEAPTAELPKSEVPPEPEILSQDEIEITTADTQPLPPELGHVTMEWALPSAKEEGEPTSDTKVEDDRMENTVTAESERASSDHVEEAHMLLDIDDYSGSAAGTSDEFHLDIDLDDEPETAPIESAFPTAEFVRQSQHKARAASWSRVSAPTVTDEGPSATPDQLATTQEFERPGLERSAEPVVGETASVGDLVDEQVAAQPVAEGSGVFNASMGQLSPEQIDAIARRAVEQLSEKVVQEIAWEVVPQLAELLIKRQLEEKNS